MLKVAGCIFILTGSIGLAFCMKGEVSAHMKLLYAIRDMLVTLSQNMRYCMLPMEHILQIEQGLKDKRLIIICKEVGEALMERKNEQAHSIWKNVFGEHKKELHLSKREQELVEEMGIAFFGKKIEENEKYARLYLERMDYVIKEEREKQNEKEKVLQTVTIMSGLVVILLLI